MKEMIVLLESAKREISSLRKENQFMRAQLSIVNVFAAALGIKDDQSGVCVDVNWEIDRKVQELINSEKEKE